MSEISLLTLKFQPLPSSSIRFQLLERERVEFEASIDESLMLED
jgi:hypothetical protein